MAGDESALLREFVLTLSERVHDLDVTVETMRILLERLGVSQESFEQQRQGVAEQNAALRQKHRKKGRDEAHDERLRLLLESLKGPKQ